MKGLLTVILLLLNITAVSAEENLHPFETDYCTNYPEGTRNQPELWKHCCLLHDMKFWAGGNKQNRYDSDVELKTCIEETGAVHIAKLMYLAVRSGSYSPVKYPDKKWNNGWRERPDYQSLTPVDIDRIEAELFSGYDYISLPMKHDFINLLRSRLE